MVAIAVLINILNRVTSMIVRQFSRLSFIIIAGCFISACKNGYVYNDARYGPIFVKPKPDQKPVRKPRPVQKVELSVKQQNEKAVAVFNDKGFDAVENEKGVVVYLPPTIYFNEAVSSITLAARTKIAEIAQEIKQPYLAKRNIEVSGHTDTLGSESANMELSKQRSLAATAELVFSKVPKARLSSVWFGETQLRVPEYTKEGVLIPENRNLNRRVEFIILNPE